MLFEGSLVNSGYTLKDPSAFSVRFYKLFNSALGIDRDAPIEDLEIDLDDISEGEDDDDRRGPRRPERPKDNIDLDDERDEIPSRSRDNGPNTDEL